MKKMILAMVLVLGVCGISHAQCETENLLEKVVLIEFADQVGLDQYDMWEFLSGYAEYRDTMDMLEKNLADAKEALQSAIDSGNSGEISTKLRAMLAADKAVFDARHAAINEAGSLLTNEDTAKLALIVVDLPAAKKALQDSLLPRRFPAAAPKAAEAVEEAAVAADPNEEVLAAVKEIFNALETGNVEKVLELISEDFYQPQVGDKDSVKDYADQGKEMGLLDDVPQTVKDYDAKLVLDDAEIEFDDDGEATVYPIDIATNQGSVTLEFVMKKESDGKWRLVGGDAYGI
ncbi:MAG: hypothetical protein GX117_02350 [Candidatus Hydrogenedentes bacterium]|nr:hypothetical protein [Candidatus Hydrogenedentota bacterium]